MARITWGGATAGLRPSAPRPSTTRDGAPRGSRHPGRRHHRPGAERAAAVPGVRRRAVWLASPTSATPRAGCRARRGRPRRERRAAWVAWPCVAPARRVSSEPRPSPTWDGARRGSCPPGRSHSRPDPERVAAVPGVGLRAVLPASPGAELPRAGWRACRGRPRR